MKRTLITILLFANLVLQARNSTDVKALFIYQFTRLIEWPADTKTGMFRIGVLGSFEAYKEISDVAIGRNVGNQNIEVMNIMNIKQLSLTDFHILVIDEYFCTPQKITEINAQLKNKSTVVISYQSNCEQGNVCIGFDGDGQNFKYFYSYAQLQARRVNCSQDFLLYGEKR